MSSKDEANARQYQRGKRDGLKGWNPSSTSVEYMDGYQRGRWLRALRKLNQA